MAIRSNPASAVARLSRRNVAVSIGLGWLGKHQKAVCCPGDRGMFHRISGPMARDWLAFVSIRTLVFSFLWAGHGGEPVGAPAAPWSLVVRRGLRIVEGARSGELSIFTQLK